MKYVDIQPSKHLRDIVSHYWTFEVPELEGPGNTVHHETLPEPGFTIAFIHQPYFTGIRLQGPQLRKFQMKIPSHSFFIGINFHPWINSQTVFGEKERLINTTDLAPTIVGQTIFREIDPTKLNGGFDGFALLERGLERLIDGYPLSYDPLIRFICLQLRKNQPIHEAIKDIPSSLRPIQKRFKAFTGLTMGEYKNIERIRRTFLSLLENGENPTQQIVREGFYDQSHFLNSFKNYMNRPVDDFMRYIHKIQIESQEIDAFLQ